MWREQMRGLPNGWHGISYDLRGFGDSAFHTDVDGSAQGLIDDLLELLDHEEIEKAVLCGL